MDFTRGKWDSIENVFEAIVRERRYQDHKWGGHDHELPGWLLIMEGELAEVKQAWLKGATNDDALREILQVVAVGVACLEQYGAVEREYPRELFPLR